jgi:hypothetical protein
LRGSDTFCDPRAVTRLAEIVDHDNLRAGLAALLSSPGRVRMGRGRIGLRRYQLTAQAVIDAFRHQSWIACDTLGSIQPELELNEVSRIHLYEFSRGILPAERQVAMIFTPDYRFSFVNIAPYDYAKHIFSR